MKVKKLLEKLKGYLGAEQRAQLVKYDSIKGVLKKLKKKENALKDKLKKEQDEKAQKRLKKEMDTLSAQRKKGMKILKELKQAKSK
jgi:hypothetical protein